MQLAALAAAQLAWLGLLLATAWAAGWLLLGRRQPELLGHPILPLVGLAALGHLALLVAALALFQRTAVAVAAGGVLVAAAPGWRQLAAAVSASVRHAPRAAAARVLAGAAALAPALVVGLYPPTAFDETTYHLPFVRAFVAEGRLPFVPHLRVPLFPFHAEVLQAALFLGGGERATHLLGAAATLLAAALLVAWGRELERPATGWVAAGIFLGSPLVIYHAGSGYVDLPLALYVTGALYAAWRWNRTGAPAWALVAGALAGTAAAVKYLGLWCLGALGAIGLSTGPAERAGAAPPEPGPLRRRTGTRLRQLALLLLPALVLLAPTYLRSWARTGNPLVPFFGEWLGTTAWSYDAGGPPASTGDRLVGILRLPWDAFSARERTGGQPPLSPVFLLSLPLLAAGCLWRREIRVAAALLASYVAIYLVVVLDVRYLLPALPLWSVAAALALTGGRGGPAARRAPLLGTTAAAWVAIGVALPGLLYAGYFAERRGPVPVEPEARVRHLAAHVPGYGAIAALERRAGDRYVVYALHAEHLHGLTRGRLLGDWSGPHRYEWFEGVLHQPALLHRRLRVAGADHLLLPRGPAAAAVLARPDLFRPVYRDGSWDLLALRPAAAAAAQDASVTPVPMPTARRLPMAR